MLHLHRSNRLENLAGALAAQLRAPVAGPLSPELIVVQSLGMRRWLQHALAEQIGVAMNIAFPFPTELLHRACNAALGENEAAHLFDREVLPWRVLRELPELLASEEATTLAHYVGSGGSNGLKSWQLAERIAGVFDRYVAHRPSLLTKGSRSDWPDGWQPRLWRALTAEAKAAHPAARLAALEKAIADGNTLGDLPPRIAIFGISSLSPLFLRLVEVLSRARDVHFFLLDPTRHYWGDIRSQRELDRLRARGRDVTHVETGHPLLASLGKLGREFHDAILELEGADASEQFTDPGNDTLLHALQRDILDLEHATPPPPIDEDRSIQLHSCHGPMREVEVLHDQLLDLFARHPGLEPRDILVAMPDVATYAPFIDAVFGSPESDRVFIPFRVADRPARTESGLADAFLRILELAPSRFTAPAVLDLLEAPAVHRRFGIGADDLPIIRGWLEAATVRWGIDAEHRSRFGVPPVEQNTWRAGLRRLLLGYALGGEDDTTLFDGVLPVREVEGSLATVLGALAEFCDHLFSLADELSADRSPTAWAQLLRRVLDTFLDASDEFADEFRQLARAIEAFATHAARAGFDEPIGFDVVRAQFAGALDDSDSGAGFLGGYVTFCALKPMRSIPFRVIALLGLSATAFPRRDIAPAFDFTAQKPQPLDRTRRDDDRFLFLEMLLSARDALILSHPGLNPKTNVEEPPSVLVSELLDFLGSETAERITTRHALQPFSPRYFGGGNLFSYSTANCLPAIEPQPRAPFLSGPLPPPEEDTRSVSLDTLLNFFAHPPKHFLVNRLGMRLPEEDEPLEESEPFGVDGLTASQLRQTIAERALFQTRLDAARPLLIASGHLPVQHEGLAIVSALEKSVEALVSAVRDATAGGALAPIAFEADIDAWRLNASLHDRYPSGCVRLRASGLKGKDLVRAWITHLAWNLAPADGQPRVTNLFSTDAALVFRPVDDPAAHLGKLLALYSRGRCEPLPFFPQIGLLYARRVWRASGRERTEPLDYVRGAWDKDATHERDACSERCFGHLDDWLSDDWLALNTAIYEPLLAHLEGELP